MPRAEWAAKAAAPALLVAVALLQWARVATDDQSTWSGVGFGMFATFEQESNRWVTVQIDVDGGLREARLPADLAGEAEGLLTVPSQAAVDRLAHALAERRWTIDEAGGARVDPAGAPARSVRVEVRGVRLDEGAEPRVEPTVVRRAEAP